MSEKELRDYVRQSIANHESGAGARVTERLLAADPDLVVLLRYANELRDLALASGKLGSFAIADGLLYIIEYITDEIGVRLTDDGGWKWVEDDE